MAKKTSLLDTIQSNLKTPTKPPETGLGTSQGVEKLLRQGKGQGAAPQSGPKQSALGERIAARQAELDQTQVQSSGQIKQEQQQAQQADINQRAEQEQKQQVAQIGQIQQQANTKIESMLNLYSSGQKKIESDQDLANLQLIGFNARLGNTKYVTQLQQLGQKKRLDDALSFKMEVAQDAFASQKNLLKDKAKLQAIIDMEDRAFNEELAKMDINYAMQILDNEMKGEQAKAQFESYSKAGAAAIQYAGDDDSIFAHTKPAEGTT